MFARFGNRRRGQGADPMSSDAIYASGGWEKLNDLAEVGRYGAITAYCTHLGAQSVLDVGCGEGLLAERLSISGLHDYVGVDFSSVAVATAEKKRISGARFIVGDADTYKPERLFDVIVFNEVLYYLQRPQRTVSRLADWLNPDGCLLVSVFRNDTDWVWRAIEPVGVCMDAVTIAHGSGLTWDLRLLRPKLPQ